MIFSFDFLGYELLGGLRKNSTNGEGSASESKARARSGSGAVSGGRQQKENIKKM
jgi:hypothetical protein